MSSGNGEVRLRARSPASISQEGSLKSPFLHPGDGGAVRSGRRGEGAGLPGLPQRIKHQSHSAAALTIIKMPQLKGDILYLRLFVSIKCIPQLLTHPEHTGGRGGRAAEGKWKSYPFY